MFDVDSLLDVRWGRNNRGPLRPAAGSRPCRAALVNMADTANCRSDPQMGVLAHFMDVPTHTRSRPLSWMTGDIDV
jgi:hypothetical protein